MTVLSMKNKGEVMEVTFNWETFKFEGITVAQVKRWEERFPDVDVIRIILTEAPFWLERKRKCKQAHKKDWQGFLLKWFKREQEKWVGRGGDAYRVNSQ